MPAAASGSNESSPINFARGLDLNSGSRECDSESKKGKMIAASTLPLENLRSNGIPCQLCDLICNMIDTINGELRGSESYDNFSDIMFDLQLMLDVPKTYLRDITLDNASSNGLDPVFAREKELTVLQSAYMRSVSGSSELVLISGAAGSGKSTLAIHFSQYITSNKGVYLCGKYDQYNQSRPFSALASAFDEYCLCLSREDESERAKTVADKLQMTFGQEDLYHLIQLIPNLALIFLAKTMTRRTPTKTAKMPRRD
jgi:hypothetical protein